MNIWMGKNPNCFQDPAEPHYGWGGDHWIAAVVEAVTEADAIQVICEDRGPGCSYEYFAAWEWEIIGVTLGAETKIHLLTYGAY